MNTFRTAVLVTVVTVLIWAFAEGESLQSRAADAEIALASDPAASHVVQALDADWTGRVEVQVEGSTARLEGLDSTLREAILLEPGSDGVPRTDGEHTIDLLIALRGHESIRTGGVTVLAVSPPSVRVRIDAMSTRSIGVRVEYPPDSLESTPSPELTSVEVRMPRRAVDSLPASAVAIARITPEALAGLPEGQSQRLAGVPLELGSGFAAIEPVRLLTARTDVNGVVPRSTLASETIATVPVVLVVSPDALSRWIVEIPLEEQSLRDVTVTGPIELIERIRDPDDELKVRAYLRLSYRDLETQIQSKQAEFPELSPLSFDVEDAVVNITISPRPEGDGDVAPGQDTE